MNWDEYFIEMAILVAQKSKDDSTKVGCVIVGPDKEVRSTGFNGFPRGVVEATSEEVPFEIGMTYPEGSIQVQRRVKMVKLPPVPLVERWERPTKYLYVEHAERNAIYNAARVGVSLKGCTAYMNFDPTPCVECTKGLIQSGVLAIVGPRIPFPGKGKHWEEQLPVAQTMLNESGVVRRSVLWMK